MEGEKPEISVVLPVFNERENLQPLLTEITSVLEGMGLPFEIVACDDGSIDGSQDILRGVAQRDNRVKVIMFSRNFGQTAALDAGFRVAKGNVIIPMDADGQNDPNDIPKLLRKLDEGYDAVSGWRKERKDPFFTKILPSRIANKLVSWVTSVNIHDYGCTLKAYRADVLQRVRLYGEMHRLIPAYIGWAGGHVTEVEVNHRPRLKGKSKYNLSRTLRLILDLMTINFLLAYSTKPLYFMGKYGVLTCGLGFLSLTWTAIKKLIWGLPLYTDPFFLASIFLFLAGFQFLFFGLLAELNMRTYFESQNKTPYFIKATMNISTANAPPKHTLDG
jgi:glycosyltransferase involved in cell wall biosynthesis